MRNTFWGLSLLCMCVQPIASYADEASETKGMEISVERKKRDTGWGDSLATITMTLRNASGQEASRKMRVKTFEKLDDGDKALTIFDSPRDIAGTAFLSFSHAAEPDEQWIFLPALKRVKRIATRNKSGPFVGSEFAFEDMVSFELEKYSFDFIREDSIDGKAVFVVQQVPKDNFSGYSKMLAWIDTKEYIVHKMEYFDRKDALLKTLSLSDYKRYEDKFWRPHSSEMVNVQSGKSTRLETTDLKFRTGLKENEFDKSKLRRAR